MFRPTSLYPAPVFRRHSSSVIGRPVSGLMWLQSALGAFFRHSPGVADGLEPEHL
jgi:hypothetical protein